MAKHLFSMFVVFTSLFLPIYNLIQITKLKNKIHEDDVEGS